MRSFANLNLAKFSKFTVLLKLCGAICLNFGLSRLENAGSDGSVETAYLRRAFAGRPCDKCQYLMCWLINEFLHILFVKL